MGNRMIVLFSSMLFLSFLFFQIPLLVFAYTPNSLTRNMCATRELCIQDATTVQEDVIVYVPEIGNVETVTVSDSYTDSYYYLHNYGSSQQINLGTPSDERIGWLKFNISDVPSNICDFSATLKLSINNPLKYEPEFLENAPILNAYYGPSNDWDEETITYSNQPSYRNVVLDSRRIYEGGGDEDVIPGERFSWNVTEAVVQSFEKRDRFVTIAMVLDKSKPTYWWIRFESKESWYGGDRPRLVLEWKGVSYEFSTSTIGSFKRDDDNKWRCYGNTKLTNANEDNVTLSWMCLSAINLTYVDNTFQELDISGNITLNRVLQSDEEPTFHWNLTEFGFDKEPKLLWVMQEFCFSDFEDYITLVSAIPEFLPLLILPLFMIATLLAVIAYRRKQAKISDRSIPIFFGISGRSIF